MSESIDSLAHLPGNQPTRASLAIRAHQTMSPFASVANAELTNFEEARTALVAGVKTGKVALAAARESSRESAAKLSTSLRDRAANFTTLPANFGVLLSQARAKKTAEHKDASVEMLLREQTAALHRLELREELRDRAAELATALRVSDPARDPNNDLMPTPGGTLKFLESARASGDEAAAEYARRELRTMLPRVAAPDERRAVAEALRDPRAVVGDLVEQHLGELSRSSPEGRGAFLEGAIKAGDPSALCATYVMAQSIATVGPCYEPWMRDLLGDLDKFPESALEALATNDSERSREEARAAQIHAQYAACQAVELAELPGVEAPTQNELILNEREKRYHGGGGIDPRIH
jgi:hypothetical protein